MDFNNWHNYVTTRKLSLTIHCQHNSSINKNKKKSMLSPYIVLSILWNRRDKKVQRDGMDGTNTTLF